MVNADAGYSQTTNAINGFSDLIVDLFGPEVGAHARVAVGMAALPLDNAVAVAAEVAVADEQPRFTAQPPRSTPTAPLG
jgi:hypothetical protein